MANTFGYTAYNQIDNEIVLAFRGTNGADFYNWMINLVYYSIQYGQIEGSLVHSGFYLAYKSVAIKVREAVS